MNKITSENKPCVNSDGHIFICNECHQPIRKIDRMIDVEVHERFNLGSLHLIGHKHLHAECAREFLKEWEGVYNNSQG